MSNPREIKLATKNSMEPNANAHDDSEESQEALTMLDIFMRRDGEKQPNLIMDNKGVPYIILHKIINLKNNK